MRDVAIEADTPAAFTLPRAGGADRLIYPLMQVVILGLFVAGWQFVAVTGLVDTFFISSPAAIFLRLKEWFVGGSVYVHLVVTMREALLGWALGSVIGIGAGFLLGRVRALERLFVPLLHLLNTLPRIALAPLFIFWFGIGELSKVVLVFTIVVFIMVFNTYAGVQTINRNYLLTARLLGKSHWQTLAQVIFPWCVPWIMTGLRLGLAWSLSGAVVGEFIAAKAGLGYLIFNAASNLDNASVMAGCVVLLGVALLFFLAIGATEKALLKWKPEQG